MEKEEKIVIVMSDIHRDIARVQEEISRVGKDRIELVLSLGDDSLNYFGGESDKEKKRELDSIGIPFLLIRGNHDKRPETLESYKEREFKGGKVYFEEGSPNLNFAKTGEVYNIKDHTGEEQRVLVIGGGYSIDKHYRKSMGIPYFENELVTEEEKAVIKERLKEPEGIDYILSHVAPKMYEPTEFFSPLFDQSKVDKSLERWLDKVYKKQEVKMWYFGHYHGEKTIDNLRMVYKNAIEFGR